MSETDDHIEYEPLRNVFRGLAQDDEQASADGLRKSLHARGFDPDELVSGAMSIVNEGLRQHRLAWQESAKRKLQAYRQTQSCISSWLSKTQADIDQAVASVLRGDWGLQAQAAFRGRTDLTTDDKAKILDDLERLRRMENGAEESGTGNS